MAQRRSMLRNSDPKHCLLLTLTDLAQFEFCPRTQYRCEKIDEQSTEPQGERCVSGENGVNNQNNHEPSTRTQTAHNSCPLTAAARPSYCRYPYAKLIILAPAIGTGFTTTSDDFSAGEAPAYYRTSKVSRRDMKNSSTQLDYVTL